MPSTDPYRQQLARFLDWHEAHATLEQSVADLSPELRGKVPAGLPYSVWQLLEHVRITQKDILDFFVNPKYVEPHWPADYWPKRVAPMSEEEWQASIATFQRDRDGVKQVALDPTIDLFATIPHGSGQTYIREILLVADHTAHHVGQIIVVRRLLGAWST